jgi:FtsP/CotA-like multicopper oxidase with cupredoxin domain
MLRAVRPLLPLALVASGLGCGVDEPPAGLPPPREGWDAAVALPLAEDLSADPRVLEVELTARLANFEFSPGVPAEVWTYNGSIPGPLLRASVGDRLIVHFTNNLPESTTIHWHGVKVPPGMDGTVGMMQPEIEPGGTFEYDFILPEAGAFWYHPHIRSNAQVGRGLYGGLIVDDPAEPELGHEVVLILDDVLLAKDGTLAPQDSGGDLGDFFGREGNVLLVNGKVDPTLLAQPGVPQRWRLVNSANSRYFLLRVDGHTLVRIGGDGGLLEAPIASEELLLVPGERADVLFTPQGPPGSTLTVRWIPFDRGYCTDCRDPVDLFRVALDGSSPWEAPPLPAPLRVIPPIDKSGASTQLVRLTEQVVDGVVVMGINGQPFGEHAHLEAFVGDTQVWRIVNETEAHHPFHLHGFEFQPLGIVGQPPPPREWKDTLNIPSKSEMRIAVTYDNRPGEWMFHCHILDHQKIGMMGMLRLMP